MARTKQTARISTGGKAPRRNLSGHANSSPTPAPRAEHRVRPARRINCGSSVTVEVQPDHVWSMVATGVRSQQKKQHGKLGYLVAWKNTWETEVYLSSRYKTTSGVYSFTGKVLKSQSVKDSDVEREYLIEWDRTWEPKERVDSVCPLAGHSGGGAEGAEHSGEDEDEQDSAEDEDEQDSAEDEDEDMDDDLESVSKDTQGDNIVVGGESKSENV